MYHSDVRVELEEAGAMRFRILTLCSAMLCGSLLPGCSGCMQALENQTKKSPNSIFGKKTDDIGEFDAKAKQEVSDSEVKVSSPMLYALEAYRPAIEQISKSQIEHAVRLFHAMHERYPRDHDEFMREIIKKNHIKLPVLPGEWKYQYNVEAHQLEVVRAIPDEEGNGQTGE